ncbi:MAG: hypothetical protein MI717_08200 [Spirochaetales bacterium]|nr:hypothetical protein [Spirochaetales bacterium]
MTNLLRFQRVIFSFLVGGLFLALFACSGPKGSLRRHDLFSLTPGTLPGELDWFYRENFRMAGTADLQVADGLIYLSGGDTGKVMVFNSFGDLLTYVYDPLRNPAPALSESGEGAPQISSWPFRTPGLISTFEGGVLIVDGVEKERRVEDEENNTFYDRVVLRFDKDGNYLGHLGREGLGGSPFPYVSALDVREDGGIVVTSRLPESWMCYWFDSEGHPVATIRIQEDQLPGTDEGEQVAVYSVRPDPVNWSMHLRLDVYNQEDEALWPESRLYTLDLESMTYGEPLVLDYVEESRKGALAVPPEYLGTVVDGSHVFLSPEDAQTYRLFVLDSQGRLVQNRRIIVNASSVVYRRFRLQNNGLLAGIFIGSDEADIAWWRLDKLVDGIQ